jgi:ABC-type glycerol-3-phosphate transport system permease component
MSEYGATIAPECISQYYSSHPDRDIFASILIIGDSNRTMPVGLAGIVGQYQVDWGLLAAGATVASLPVLILFGLVGRNFVEGLVSGAIK